MRAAQSREELEALLGKAEGFQQRPESFKLSAPVRRGRQMWSVRQSEGAGGPAAAAEGGLRAGVPQEV